MFRYLSTGAIVAACAMLWLAPTAVTTHAQEGRDAQREGRVRTTETFRASTLTGMTVYNARGEEVGSIHELVINVEKGKVEYAALAVGGFLGIGEKLFAVPWNLFRMGVDDDRRYFVLDVDKAKLEQAPGFDKNNWPNVADPNWAEEINRYYGNDNNTHQGIFERFDGQRLVMTDARGESTHSHHVADNLKVTSEGETVDASTLRRGDHIRVTLARHDDGQMVVSKIERLAAPQPQR